MEPVIQVKHLCKEYQLGESAQFYASLREALAASVRRPWNAITRRSAPAKKVPDRSFRALNDISFDVHKGETVAIIGSNGAGKSTLLKILSRITDPSAGYAQICGRVASLLEVGTGFHPELTGRENIYLNGAILGMSRAEIAAKFNDITAFAGIGNFLDTPVKRYSSGMYVRLAFSIAAHLDPEVLIVDEVLAVGDVAFQKKCLGKMAEACARARTLLFVSHNLAAVESLCTRAIVLQHGRLAFNGSTREAIQFYLQSVSSEGEHRNANIVELATAPGRPTRYQPVLTRLELFDGEGRPLGAGLPAGAPLKAIIRFTLEQPCTSFDAFLVFETASGQRVCMAHSAYEPQREHDERTGPQAMVCDIPCLPLIPGEYRVCVGIDITNQEVDCVQDATRLTILKSDYYRTGILPDKGLFLVSNRWTFEPAPIEVHA